MHEGVEVITGAGTLRGRLGLSINLNTPQAALLIASLAASAEFEAKPKERTQLVKLASSIASRWSGY